MYNNYKIIDIEKEVAWKYVFEKDNFAIEAVLSKEDDFYKKTTIRCSIMSNQTIDNTSLNVDNKIKRNLTSEEIVDQVLTILDDKKIKDINSKGKKFQIMFMSMGEPMLNWNQTETAIIKLHKLFPNVEILLSTIGINDNEIFKRIIQLSKDITKLSIQFNITTTTNYERSKLIPYENIMSLIQIRDAGIEWWTETGRMPLIAYFINEKNNTWEDSDILKQLFSSIIFKFIFGVDFGTFDIYMSDKKSNKTTQFIHELKNCGYKIFLYKLHETFKLDYLKDEKRNN